MCLARSMEDLGIDSISVYNTRTILAPGKGLKLFNFIMKLSYFKFSDLTVST